MIPYNPSSFDRNKTLLENILELKKWLQAHPSYEIFYSSANGNTTQSQTYNLSTITDSTNLEAGDVVIFANTTLAVVLSVDTDLSIFVCDTAESFKGPQGATGSTGATGNGIASITLTSSVGLVDTYTILYTNGTSTNYTITNGQNGTNGTNGTNGISITNVEINNGALVCTLSDGNIINAGMIYQEIGTSTNTSGTLTATQLGYILNNYETIWHTNSTTTPKFLAKLRFTNAEAGQYYTYSSVVKADDGNEYYVEMVADVVAETYTRNVVQLGGSVEGTSVLSTGETSGKVLTANGSGGASWQTAGGGSGKYMHCYQFRDSSNSDTRIYFSVVLSSSSGFTNVSNLANELLNIYNGTFLPATGKLQQSANYYIVSSISNYSNSGIRILAYDPANSLTTIDLNPLSTITIHSVKVITL